MKERNEKQVLYDAQMTVFLTISLAVIIPLLFTMIEATRISASQLYLECVVDMGTDSILAEYHRELFNQYGLLFIDTSYGTDQGSLDLTSQHLSNYMSYNLSPQKELLLFGNKDFYRLHEDDIQFLMASRATDENGAVFEHMAMAYMLDKYGISYISDIKNVVNEAQSNQVFDQNIIKDNESAQAKIDAIELPEPEEGEEFQDISIDNPTEGVNKVRSKGILSLVCKEPVSGKGITPSLYVSKRSLVKGDGMWQQWENTNPLEKQLLMNEYYMLKAGNFRKLKNDSLLDYQVEYLIAGKSNDTDNLKSIANRLLLIRGGANTTYFFLDEELMAEAEAAAAALSCVVALPELEIIFQAAIVAAWIYAESVYDVKLLFEGEKVPLVKMKGQWNLSLEKALDLSQESFNENQDGYEEGLDYEMYLRLLLYTTTQREKNMRMMDLIEMDIRKTKGSEAFRLDDCIAAYEVQIIFVSDYGYSYLMKREKGYF